MYVSNPLIVKRPFLKALHDALDTCEAVFQPHHQDKLSCIPDNR